MWFAIGWLLGGTHCGQRLGRVLTAMGAWIVLPWIASWAALAHIHEPWAGYVAGLATMGAMLAFACTPRPGPTRVALLEGLVIWSTLALLVTIVRVAFHMIGAGFVATITQEWKWIGIGMASVALAALAHWRIEATTGDKIK